MLQLTSIFLISPQSGASTEKHSTDFEAKPSLPINSRGIFSDTVSVPMKTTHTFDVVPSSSLLPVVTRTVYGMARKGDQYQIKPAYTIFSQIEAALVMKNYK